MALAAALPAYAQVAPPAAPAGGQDEPAPEAEGEIVVSGQLRGAVPGDIKPEIQLSPADIRSYGASNVTELLNALGPQLGSGSGRGDEQPVILISGRRANMAEVRNLPTEAIERIDILPEEAALQFGYGANQKVINFVLRQRFQALTGVLEAATPTAGGSSWQSGNANLLKIRRNHRLELDVKYSQNSGLLESERGIARADSSLFDTRGNITGILGGEIDPALSALAGTAVTIAGVPADAALSTPTLADYAVNANVPNIPNLGDYRTLSGTAPGNFGYTAAPQRNFELSGTYTPAISDHVTATATFGVTANTSEALLGLPRATLILPAGNPYSSFTQDVRLLRYYDMLEPLSRSRDANSVSGNVSVNGDTSPWLASWRWSLQASYRYDDTNTETTTGIDADAAQARLDALDPGFNPFGPMPASLVTPRPDQIAKSNTTNGKVDFSTFGSLFRLPAEDVKLTLRVAGETQDKQSESRIAGVFASGDVARDTGTLSATISVPLTSRRRAFLDAIGDLSLNGQVEVEQLSDFGQLSSTEFGLSWSPITQIRATLSVGDDQGAPSASDLGDPVVVTPNQRVYDAVRNETVDITAITGGNPDLLADSRHRFSAGVRIRPLDKLNLTFNARYNESRFRDYTSSFPGATAEIEAAFPERFVRAPDGQLLSIDYRRVNFERRETSELRWGIDFSIPISSPQATRMRERREAFQAAMAESRRTGQPLPPEMSAQLEQFRRLGQQQSLFGGNQFGQGQGQRQGQGQGEGQGQAQGAQDQGRDRGEGPGPGGGPGGGRGFGGPGRGFGGPGGGNQVRFTFTHRWLLKDEVLIRSGLPIIDRLDGSSGQGTPAHEINLMAAVKRDAWLLQTTGNWVSGWQSMTGTTGSQTRLDFGSLARVGVMAEYNPAQNIDTLLKHPWMRGARIQLRVENLFDAKQRVVDQNGETPAAFVPNLRDPFGRIVRLTFRKQFF